MNQTIRTSIDIQNWPELDRSLWRAALHVSTFLEPNGIAAHWADATKNASSKGLWQVDAFSEHDGRS